MEAAEADAAAASVSAPAESVDAVELAEAEAEQGVVDPEAAVAAEIETEEAEPAAQAEPAVRKVDMPEPEAIDLLGEAGSPVLKRALPLAGLAVVVFVLWRVLRRRK